MRPRSIFRYKVTESSAVTEKFDVENYRVTLTKYPFFDAFDEEIVELSRTQVHPDDVHFLGYYVNGSCRFHIDVLGDPQLISVSEGLIVSNAGRAMNALVTNFTG